MLQIRVPRVVAALLVGAALAAAGTAYRGCSATRWSRPTSSASRRARRSARCSGSFLSLGVSASRRWRSLAGLRPVGARLRRRLGARRRRPDPGPGALGRGGRRARGRRHLAAQGTWPTPTISCRPSPSGCSAASPASTARGPRPLLPPVLLGLVPLALLRWRHQRALARRRGGPRARRRRGLPALVVDRRRDPDHRRGVAISGVIGWIGLIVPHIARMLVGPDFGRLLPAAMLLGAGYLLLVDTLARTHRARSRCRSAS